MAKVVLADFNVLLVFFRTGQGWGQAELADAAGIPASLLNDYERGRKTLTRNRLEHLADVMGIPTERIDESLACLAANRSAAAGAGQEPDGPGATRRRVEAVAIRAGRLMTDFARSVLTLMTIEGEALVARQRAERQMARLRKRTPSERLFLVGEGRHFRNWALAESAALESVAKAPNHPDEALDWARLAVRIAVLVPGEEVWRRRLEGWALHFQANAERACNVLPAAGLSLARARKLWKAGEGGDPGRLLNEVWLPWIEANLLLAQREFAEALRKIDEALDLDPGERRGQILLSKSNILWRLDDPEQSTAVLLEAEALIDARREPRLAFGVRFNLLVDLCDLGRAAEARPRLGAVREIAEGLGEPLDLTRLELPRFRGHHAPFLGEEEFTMPRSRPPYPPEFRRQMIELVRAGRDPGHLAKEFEPSAQAIRNWVKQADVDEGRREDDLTSAEHEELRRLRRENRQLREEREILAKAAAWFARETGSVPPKGSNS